MGKMVTTPNAQVSTTADSALTLSIHPGAGSLQLALTMDGRTMHTGIPFARTRSNRSVIACGELVSARGGLWTVGGGKQAPW